MLCANSQRSLHPAASGACGQLPNMIALAARLTVSIVAPARQCTLDPSSVCFLITGQLALYIASKCASDPAH